jgi:hypothetical protein
VTAVRRGLFYVLVVVGVLATAVFWRMPANKYEWMRDDPVIGDPSATLPEDPDALFPLVLFAVPPLVVAAATLLYGGIWLRGRTRLAALGFSLILVLVVIAKFAIS